MAKRKFTAKQIAAQKLFAKRAKAGTLKKPGKRKATRKNPRGRKIDTGHRTAPNKYVVVIKRHGKERMKKFANGLAAFAYAHEKLYDIIASYASLDTKWGRAAYEKLRDEFKKNGEAVVEKIAGEDNSVVIRKTGRATIKNPRRKVTRAKARKVGAFQYAIRGVKPTGRAYEYFYLKGSRFVKNISDADTFSKSVGEAKMRAIQSKLPLAIDRITLERVT